MVMFYRCSLALLLLVTSSIAAVELLPYHELEEVFSSNNHYSITQAVERLKEENPEWVDIYIRYAQFLQQRGLTHEAIEQLEQALLLPEAADFAIETLLAQNYALINEDAKALSYAQSAFQKDSENSEVLLDYLWLLYKNLRTEDALQVALSHQSELAESIGLASMLAILYGDLGYYNEATTHYQLAEDIVSRYGMSPSTILPNYYNQYLLELDFLQFEQADRVLRKAHDIDTENPLILRLMGAFYHDQMNFERSLHYYNLAETHEIARSASNAYLRTPLGKLGIIDLYLDFGKIQEASLLIEEVKRQKQHYGWMKFFGINPNFFESRWRAQELHYLKLAKRDLELQRPAGLWAGFMQMLQGMRYSFLIFGAQLAHQRSQLEAADHARSLQNLKNLALFSLESRHSYPELQRTMISQSQHLFTLPSEVLRIKIYQTKTQRKEASFSTIMQELQSPYQHREQLHLMLSMLQQLRMSASQRHQIAWQLYAISPYFAQYSQFPLQLDLTGTRKPKAIRKQLKKIGIIASNNAPYHLTIKEDNSSLYATLSDDRNVLMQWQATKQRGGNEYELLRQELFSINQNNTSSSE
jgi:hypothetical protein